MKLGRRCSYLTALLMVVVFIVQGFSFVTAAETKNNKVPAKYKKAVYQSGVDLSKKKGDYYTSQKEEYIDTSRFILYLQEGAEIPVNIIELINHVMDQVEKATGYTFYVKDRVKDSTGMQYYLEKYFKSADKMLKLNTDHHKVEILILNKATSGYGEIFGGYGVVLDSKDTKIVDENGRTILRSLLHIITSRNGVHMGYALSEGFVQYYTDIILKKDKILTSSYSALEAEWGYDKNIINENNMEKLFLTQDGGSASKIGFRLIHYLIEEYGEDAYRRVQKQATNLNPNKGIEPSLDIIVKALKTEFSKNFFKEFAKWHSKNRERFGDEDLSVYGDWYIKDNTLIKYFGSDTNITIPKTVTKVEEEAFRGCDTLEKVKIPDTVTEISRGVFIDCKKLKEIVIPDSVSYLYSNTFDGCTSLKKIVLPNSLTTIQSSMFYGCESLSNITLPDGITSISSNAFSYCYSLKNITLPKGISNLGVVAFSYCTSIEEIVLPKDITEISEGLFMGCTNLKKITIPDKVTSIGRNAFLDNTKLKSIVIPKSVTNIGEGAFKNCPNLIIYGVKGSYAETFAKKNNITFKLMK